MKLPRALTGAAGLALLVTTPLAAQDTAPPAVPDSVQELVSEFQQLQARLQQTQAQAVQGDTALQSEQQELQQTVTDAIIEMDPAMEAKMDSLPELQQAAMAAQQAGDTARVRELMGTGRRLQGQIQEAQQEAMQNQEVAQALEAFQDHLMAEMEEIDPGISSVVDRLEELSSKLQAIQSGGG